MSLWKKKRNTKYWEAKDETVNHVLIRADEVLQSWKYARGNDRHEGTAATSSSAAWQPPPAGYLKCNLDAAIFRDQNYVGAGACV